MFRQTISCILPALFLLLAGCASSDVELETSANVPEPLVNPYPFKAAIYFPQETREHVYEADNRDGKSWSVTTGSSQTSVLKQILGSMFSVTGVVESLEDAKMDHDVVLIPKLTDMQFAVPRETGFAYFEVWIKYQLLVTDPNGKTIAVIPFQGYGKSSKSSKSFLTDDSKGLHQAASAAFRDLGAKLIVNFIKNPDIQQWHSSNTSGTLGK